MEISYDVKHCRSLLKSHYRFLTAGLQFWPAISLEGKANVYLDWQLCLQHFESAYIRRPTYFIICEYAGCQETLKGEIESCKYVHNVPLS